MFVLEIFLTCQTWWFLAYGSKLKEITWDWKHVFTQKQGKEFHVDSSAGISGSWNTPLKINMESKIIQLRKKNIIFQTSILGFHVNLPGCSDTLSKTNIAPENRPLEREIPIGNHHFQVLC